MNLAAFPFKLGIDPLEWGITPSIDIGGLSVSPHGIGIAIGYLAGAQLMVRRARRLGGPPENDIWNALFYALIGAIVGARLGYVLGHFSEVTEGGDDLLGVFKVWEGGISLLGGITGAVLFALPYAVRRKMGFWRSTDLAVPGLALGIVIGRVGDLVIGDHLGDPTTFALGWRCTGETGGVAPASAATYERLAESSSPSLGCFDVVLHQTALYDFVSTLLLLGVLLYAGRTLRRQGMLTLLFVTWYGTMRVITDFLRVDKRYLGLTGSQLLALSVVLASLYMLARYRGAPPRFAMPPGSPDAEGDEEAAKAEPSPEGDHSP